MSKVYKSGFVSIGAPKPIVNNFEELKKTEAKADHAEESVYLSSDEHANSIIEDAKQMYLKIIEEANAEAQGIMEAAEKEAQKLMADSREKGYMEGCESGFAEGRKEAQAIIDEAVEIREFLDDRKECIFREAEEQVLELVLSIARKVIGDELTQNKEAILSLVNMALQKCAFKKKLVLKVSNQDLDFLLDNKKRICMMVEGISDIDIEPDFSLAQGSCIIETPSGEINSGIDVQISEVERIFTYLLRNE